MVPSPAPAIRLPPRPEFDHFRDVLGLSYVSLAAGQSAHRTNLSPRWNLSLDHPAAAACRQFAPFLHPPAERFESSPGPCFDAHNLLAKAPEVFPGADALGEFDQFATPPAPVSFPCWWIKPPNGA